MIILSFERLPGSGDLCYGWNMKRELVVFRQHDLRVIERGTWSLQSETVCVPIDLTDEEVQKLREAEVLI